MAAGRLVGTSVLRLEDNRLLLGQGRFVADISVSRPLFMSIVRSKKAHAIIDKIETKTALSPGVRRVVVGSELVDSVAPLPSIDMAGEGVAACFRVLSIGKVRYVGEPVAAVFAEDPFQAYEAAELVDIQYRDLPVVLDPEQAASDKSPALLYESLGSNIIHTCNQSVGDPDGAFAAAHRTFEDTYRIHRYVASPMETRGVLADPTGRNGRVTLYSSTQFPHLVRGFLAGVLGISETDLHEMARDARGTFHCDHPRPGTGASHPGRRRSSGYRHGCYPGVCNQQWCRRCHAVSDPGFDIVCDASRSVPHTELQGEILVRRHQQDAARSLSRSRPSSGGAVHGNDDGPDRSRHGH